MFIENDFLHRIPRGKKALNELLNLDSNSKNLNQQTNIKDKFISETLIKLNDEEKNTYLNIMIGELSLYKYEKSEAISRNSMNAGISSSKNLLYNFLEKYLMEISYITDKEKRDDKIREVYEWYKEKKKLGKDLQTLTYKSYKDKNEVDEQEYLLTKQQTVSKIMDFEKNHRNMKLINKKMLDDYERKKVKKPFWALKKAIQFQTASSLGTNTITSSTNFSGNTFDKIDLSSLYSYSKGTNNITRQNKLIETSSFIDKPEGGTLEKDYLQSNSQNFEENIFLPNVNKEPKFSYSYLRPLYDLNNIYLENKIIEEKNKLLNLKREQEEIKEKMKEYCLFRAKFKENLNNKYEMKNLLNMYANDNNLSSILLKKYKIKEKEKMKTIEIKSYNEFKSLGSGDINKTKKSVDLNLNKNFQSESVLYEEDSNYSNSNFKTEKNEKDNSTRVRSNSQYSKIISNLTKINLFELDDDKNKDKEDRATNFIKNFRFSLSKKLPPKKRKKTIVKRKSDTIQSNIFPLKLISGSNAKINIGKIQNLEKDSKTIKSTDNYVIKEYKLKFPEEKTTKDLINKNQKEKNSDALPKLLSNDILNKEKLAYKQLCNINTNITNQTYLESDVNQKTKMILFNKENVDKVNKQILIKIKKRNHFETLNNRYNTFKNNLLNMRRSISNEKRKEYQSLVDKIKLKKLNDYEFNDEKENEINEIENLKTNPLINYKFRPEEKNNSILHALVNPKDNFNYSRFYLPRNGSMLLSRDKTKKFFS